jgi:hypothetical protein
MIRRIAYEQRVADRPFGVVVLRAKSNRLADLLPLVSQLHVALSSLQAGEVKEVAG